MHTVILPTAYPNIYNENSAIFVQNQAEALAKNSDIKVSVIGAIPISLKDIWERKLFKFGYFKYTKQDVNIRLFLFPSIPKLKKINTYFRYLFSKKLLTEYHQENKIDIIHLHNSIAGRAALWFKNIYNIPYCITEHSTAFARGLLNKNEISQLKSIYQHSSYNIAVSKEFCTLLNKTFNLKFNYIPNIVNTTFFKMSNNREIKGFKFINIAYLDKKKNHILLIHAFHKVFHKLPQVTLSILGSGTEYHILQKEIISLGMQHQIELHGFANRTQILKALQNSNAFVLSSLYETFGVVLIEAMSCGLPVISTKCGGPESIIINKKLGILVNNNNLEELATGMYTLYKNKYDSDYIRKYCVENFSEEVISQKLKKVYQEVIKKENI